MKSANKVLTTLSLSAVLLVTGCSKNTPEVAPRPMDTSTATSTASGAATASPVYTSEADTPIVTQKAAPKQEAPTKSANDGKGDYVQTGVADDDAVMKLDPNLVNDGAHQAGKFPFPDYESGQQFAAKFIAEEIIDSNLTGNDSDEEVEKWWAANKDKFDMTSQTAFHDSLKKNSEFQTLVLRNSLLGKDKKLVYGANKKHITDRTISIVSVKDSPEGKAIIYKATVDFKVNKDVNGTETKTPVQGDITLTLTKDNNNNWVIVSGVSVFKFS